MTPAPIALFTYNRPWHTRQTVEALQKNEFLNAGSCPKPLEYFLKNDISIPRNPILARLFRAVKLAENAGYGFDKMIAGWKAYTNKAIDFESDLDTTKAVFYLETATEQVTEQVTDQVTEQAVLQFCITPKTTGQIMEHLGLSHREHFRASILKPMIEKELLILTIPDKPTSPKQKYVSKLDINNKVNKGNN